MGNATPRLKSVFLGLLAARLKPNPFEAFARLVQMRDWFSEIGSVRLVSEIGTETLE
jgi:hypothetical protein